MTDGRVFDLSCIQEWAQIKSNAWQIVDQDPFRKSNQRLRSSNLKSVPQKNFSAVCHNQWKYDCIIKLKTGFQEGSIHRQNLSENIILIDSMDFLPVILENLILIRLPMQKIHIY